LVSHQPTVLFSQNKPAASNQPTVLFSRNKLAPAISHQPNKQAAELSAGTAQVLVEMKLLNDANEWTPSEARSGTLLQSFQLTLAVGSA
jgi:hypothetical protein